jgi:hypothetical protein
MVVIAEAVGGLVVLKGLLKEVEEPINKRT